MRFALSATNGAPPREILAHPTQITTARQMIATEERTKMETEASTKGLTLGNHQFPVFDGMSAAFGANGRDYPKQSDIPAKFYAGRTPYNSVVSSLFFRGGSLRDFGLTFKSSIDSRQAMTAIKALLSSFEPKHEIKEATVAWALSEWCDGDPKVD